MTERYVELRCQSAFSFLRGASLPEDLIEEAARLGYVALGLGDRDGLYGAPRFFRAAKGAGIRPLVGAEVVLESGAGLYLLVENRVGYKNLCRLLTQGKLGRDAAGPRHGAGPWAGKRPAGVTLDDLVPHVEGLFCLAGGASGPFAAAAARRDAQTARATLARLQRLFGERLAIDLQRHLDPQEERCNRFLADLARAKGVRLAVTNDVRHARRRNRPLLDVLTCIREKLTLDGAGRRLLPNAERHLKAPAEIAELFRDAPQAIRNTLEIADRCRFTLADLGYRFPDFPLPPGVTADQYLRHLTLEGARRRYGDKKSNRLDSQLDHELAIIEKLGLAGYFLIVWEIVEFCRREGILVQGRGSAANSAVCYVLGITAVDAVGMDLLFERFLSEERGEWPDIDLDLPSGAQRERVIQHVYERYGARGAAMTANVITYRARSAVREISKALGFPPAEVDRLSKCLRAHGYRDDFDRLGEQLKNAGLDADSPRVRHLVRLADEIESLPRHLGQHSGGMVIAAGRLDEVVPLEPASMPGRVVIQWDKEDCADLGIIKVDLLGLGMMAVLEEAIPLVRRHEGVELDLAQLPPDDPEVYGALQKADTIGVFQIESRAQMATLPRMKPQRFYDLVVEVAIIRPGPIVGQMVHPYLNRRAGREPVRYPHPLLEPILRRTLGVPLFQEQLLRIAMVAASFTPGEAEELRRAMGFKRSVERMHAIEQRLRDGMAKNGITGKTAEEIVHAITSFALYGFPECVDGETRVLDAQSGRRIKIEDVALGRERLEVTLACDADLKLRPRRVLKALASGSKRVFRVRTALGREIMATAEHPFLTIEGWRNLERLRVGDHVATARQIPNLARKRWAPHQLIVLADLIAEGNLCHPTTFYFYTAAESHRDEFIRAVERFDNTRATVARHRSCYSIHVRRQDGRGPVGAVEWIKKLGLWGLGSHAKHLPDAVFELDAASLALLLARLWEGDGHISLAEHASYDTVSRRLAEDVQHALLRLGIVSRIYERTRPYRDRFVTAFTVTITGQKNLRRFRLRIARRFLDPRKRDATEAYLSKISVPRSSRDVIPVEAKALIDGERRRRQVTWNEIAEGAGISVRAVCSPDVAKRGYMRWVIASLARYFRSAALARLAKSDLYWDRVTVIEPMGWRETYDLQIEGDHNFLANDFVVHNSHAASFALIAYASAYLKVHHPAAFLCAMLNGYPLGFYHPATLVKDAQRHGVEVRAIDVTRSDWSCGLEDGAVRLGLRYVRGLREEAGRRIEAERRAAPFSSLADFVRRTELRRVEFETLAHAGALAGLGLDRREALWQLGQLDTRPQSLLYRASGATPSPLPAMRPLEETVADYAGTGMTVGPHMLAHLREELAGRGVRSAAELRRVRSGSRVKVVGHVIVRQRPGTAKGLLFLTLEDETGTANAVVMPDVFEKHRALLHTSPILLVEGPVENVDGVIHVRGERFEAIPLCAPAPPSHDFH